MDIRTDLAPLSGTTVYGAHVRSRIHDKMLNYAQYRFRAPESCAINIFFDLAQEFPEPAEIHLLTVLILRMFFQYEAELYLKEDAGGLTLVTPALASESGPLSEFRPEIWNDGARWHIPVRKRNVAPQTGRSQAATEDDAIGLLLLYGNKAFESHDLLFLEKFANRVGFCLHDKRLALRNARHVLFLRKLAHDIGHNIITPNMRLKMMIRQLERQISSLGELGDCPPCETSLHDIRVLQRKMAAQAKAIMDNFQNSALFLESLLRQSHFDLGHYVLHCSRLDICEQVLKPQFERYRAQLAERNLLPTNAQPGCPGAPCIVEADHGLISQVLANFFSNAIKYAAPVWGGRRGEVRCGAEIVPDGFGPGRGAAKVSVFSSGRHIPPEEAAMLFEDNFRASNSAGEYGTGHGLFFVREIIAEHGGKSVYEAVEGGNLFSFLLPLVEENGAEQEEAAGGDA